MDARLTQDIRNWWGLARRRCDPVEIEPTLIEKATCALTLSLVLNLFVLILLSLRPVSWLFRGFYRDSFGAFFFLPLGLGLLSLSVGVLSPSVIWKRTPLAGFVALCREQGWLVKGDQGIVFGAALGVVLALLQHSAVVYWPTLVIVCLQVMAIAIGLKHFKEPTWLVPRTWAVSIPEWLRPPNMATAEPGGAASTTTLVRPASPLIYRFDVGENARANDVELMISIDEETMIKPLRAMNAKFGGRFYFEHHMQGVLKMVYGQGDPALETGINALASFCNQIEYVSRTANLSPYQQASCVLRFVHRAIKYEKDADSTERILGRRISPYGRFPIETLFDRVGDDDCKAILVAALLANLGFDLLLMKFPTHHALGLKVSPKLFARQFSESEPLMTSGTFQYDGVRYFYADMIPDQKEHIGFGPVPTGVELAKLEAAVQIPAVRSLCSSNAGQRDSHPE